MLSSRLFWRTYLTFATLVLCAAFVLSAWMTERQRALALAQIRAELNATIALFRASGPDVFRGAASPGLNEELRRLQAASGVRLAFIREDATLVAGSSDKFDTEHVDILNLSELMTARGSGRGEYLRPRRDGQPAELAIAERIGGQEHPEGFIRAARDLDPVEAQLAALRRTVWGAAALFALVSFAATYWLVGKARKPLKELQNAAASLAEDEFTSSVPLELRDEIGALARAFANMRTRLQGRLAELRGSNQRLGESSERLSAVLAGMIEGVIALDNSERILFLNRAAQSFFRVKAPNVVGRPIWEVIRNPTLQDVVRDALQGRQLRTAEFELPRSQTIVALIASQLPGNPCPGVVLVVHNVTELRRLENLRSEFVSNVSHELKTPLAAIQAYAETLLGGAIDDPEHNREFLRRIEEQAERLHSLVLDLLNLARIESGADVFDVTAVDAQDVINHCLDEHAAVAEASGLSLSTDSPHQPTYVRADKNGLRTILDNLVDNAIKYTPAGGRVTIECAAAGDSVRISVTDTGVGIPESQQARVFERFYRVDRARSRELGGSGLGLSIVKHLAHVFGGSVEVESRVGQGSKFSVLLPKA